jgi:phage tail sheath protein FI
MPTTYNLSTPGVYIQEIPVLPPSIASVPTAIPAFVGYTQRAAEGLTSLSGVPFQIESMMEYQQYFGGPQPEPGITVTVDDTQTPPVAIPMVDETKRSKFLMYYALQMYFANGGGTCYVLSIGPYNDQNTVNLNDYMATGNIFSPVLEKYNDITLVVCPDALGLDSAQNYYSLQTAVIAHCVLMQNRLAVMDVYPTPFKDANVTQTIKFLRNDDDNKHGLAVPDPANYKFGAVYYPRIKTNLPFSFADPADPTNRSKDHDELVNVKLQSGGDPVKLSTLKGNKSQIYYACKGAIANDLEMLLPAAPAVVGVYAAVDDAKGVWYAPANIGIVNAVDLEQHISAKDQGPMNVDTQFGLSVNVIRPFPGRGPAIIYGARTLAGNDNEWRYINVRRFYFMVEQSVKNAIEPFVFSPNDENTWTRVKAMIGNYLTEQWKAGALMGASPKEAFYVHVGLGETMSFQDVLEGRMIVQIGMAVVRPAEFIILQFMQIMQSPS